MDADQYLAELMATSHRSGVPFPEEEYHERVRKVRKEMEADGLDALLVTYPCNLYYVSGYYTFGVGNHACLVLPLDGDAALQLTSMEIPAGVVNSWVKNFVVAEWRGQESAGEQLAELVREMGLESGRLGIEPSRPGLMPPVLQSLKSSLPLASLADASDLVASGAVGEITPGTGLPAKSGRLHQGCNQRLVGGYQAGDSRQRRGEGRVRHHDLCGK